MLERHGIGDRPTIFWVYPTNAALPWVIDELDPDIVVADVVDDNRTWHDEDSALYDLVEQNYEDVLTRSDVVLANCEPVAETHAAVRPRRPRRPERLRAADRHAGEPAPAGARGLSRPDHRLRRQPLARIDIPLLETLAAADPAWHFVFLGSAHLDRSVLRLDRQPNVRFVGVKPYEEALRFIRHFDVGLIPHLDNDMTRSMNPLKAFVYCAAGVPVVSSRSPTSTSSPTSSPWPRDPIEFAAAIEDALRAGRRPPDADALAPHSWEVRVDQAIRLIDRAYNGPETPR